MMFVCIDLDKMQVTHKHEDQNLLGDLAVIELGDSSYCLHGISDGLFLKRFTDMELKILYRNLVGIEPVLTRNQLIQVIHGYLVEAPVTDADPIEADEQADFVLSQQSSELGWTYVKGARKPALMGDIFEGVRVEQNKPAEDSAKRGNLPALKPAPYKRPRRPVKPEKPVTPNTPQVSPPKQGTRRSLIWETADSEWESQGSPKNKSEVLKIRKSVMDKLEGFGVPRSSASAELGKWHKDRAPF